MHVHVTLSEADAVSEDECAIAAVSLLTHEPSFVSACGSAQGDVLRLNTSARRKVWLSCLALALSACAPTAKDFGEQLFNDPLYAGSQFNAWACATCHSTSATDTRILSGSTMVDVASRPSWWGGNEVRLIDAASFCYVSFMRGAVSLNPTEPRSRALYEYLKSISPSPAADPQPLTVVQNVKEVPRGDATRGAEVYRLACLSCHGEVHTGAGRNSDRASILPDVQADYGTIFPGVAPSLVFVEKVRHGQFFGVSGNMPLFSTERLSDEDLGALLQYFAL